MPDDNAPAALKQDAVPLEEIDVSDPDLYRNDCFYDLFARLRREDPVHFRGDSPYGPYWSVTKYDDIMKVELDHATYSSNSTLGGIQLAERPMSKMTTSFIRMDPPRHTEQRKTVAPIVARTNLKTWKHSFACGQQVSSTTCRVARRSIGSKKFRSN